MYWHFAFTATPYSAEKYMPWILQCMNIHDLADELIWASLVKQLENIWADFTIDEKILN
jgi:hypothetical protein